MKPSKAHLTTAQRIYDRLGRGSVADIDAIAAALAEAEREERKRCAKIARDRFTVENVQKDARGYPYKSGWTAINAARCIYEDILGKS